MIKIPRGSVAFHKIHKNPFDTYFFIWYDIKKPMFAIKFNL